MKYAIIAILFLTSCAPIKVVTERPNLRRIEAQVFTDEHNKLYIYTKHKSENFWKP